jgi:hypothetical protein
VSGNYQVTRAAVEVERVEQTPEALELVAIDRQTRRFSLLSLATIVVSFVHMVSALALFSGEHWYEGLAAMLMTGLVDFATWAVAGYIDYAKRRGLSRSGWVLALFYAALGISGGLNFAYLYANRPPAEKLPSWASVLIAVVFAFFIPACIGVASLIRGELEDDRLRQEQRQAAKSAKEATVREVREMRNRATQRPNEVEQPVLEGGQQRYNAKSLIATTDVASILDALQAAGVQRFQFAKTIGDTCGWSSPSSSTKALGILREAGALREVDGGYEVVERQQ